MDFAGERPDFHALLRRWKEILGVASEIVEALPTDEAGKRVLMRDSFLYTFSTVEALRRNIDSKLLKFRRGCIGGVLPTVSEIR